MKEFKFRISADVADLEAQFKSGANQLAKFVQGIDKAENKLEKLQETSAYLSQMDAALSSLASKYPNIFKQIFGNVDADIKNAIKPILEMQELMSTVVNQTGSKLQNILGGTGGTAAEFKEIANTMSILSKALGQNAPDFSFLEGAGDATEKANKLLNVLQDIVQESYNFKNTGSDSVGAVINEIAESSTNAASKIDELKTKIKELISIANKKREELYTKEDILGELESPKNVSKSTQYLKNRWSDLIKLMQESQEARAKFNKGEMLSEADYESLLKYIDAASKLRATLDTVNSGKMSVNQNIFDQIRMQLSKIPQTLPYLENLQERIQPQNKSKKKDKASQVESSKAPIQTSKAYEELNQQIEKYIQLKKESAKLDEESPEWESKAEEMDQILSDIAGKYKLSEDALETLGDKLMQRGIGVQKAMKILKDTLGDQFPSATVDQNDSVGIKETKTEAIQTASEIETLGDKSQESFSEVANASQQATDALKDQILQVQTLKELYALLMQEEYNFRNGQTNGKEYLAMFNKNGLSNIGTSDGADITSDTIKKILSKASSNGDFMSLHNHPNGMDMPSVSDLLTWAQDFVNAGVKINGIITSSGITTIDFSDMDIDGIQKVIEKYKNIIQQDKLLNKFLDTSDPGALKWNETIENKIKEDSKFKAEFTEMEPQIRAGISGALRNALNQALQEVGGKPLLSFEGKDMIPDFEKYLGAMSQDIGVDPTKIQEGTAAIKEQTEAVNENSTAQNSNVENQIQSYEHLIELLTEYQNLEKQKKKVDRSPYDFYIDTQFTEDKYSDSGKEAIMKDFQDIWSKKNKLNQERIKSPAYLDQNMNETAKREIAEYEEELKKLAAAYVNLGGSVDDFKSKEKRAFAQENVDLFNSQKEQFRVANAEVDKYNEQFEKRQAQIARMLKADGTDIGNTAELIQHVETFGDVEESAKKMAQTLGVEVPQSTNAAGVAVENLKAKAEEAKTKFFELTKSLDSDLFAGRYDEFSLGKSQAELDKAQQELKELADAGHIAADVMEEVDAAYKKTSSAISASYEGIRNENMYKEESGSYDQGYFDAEKRFENDRNDYIKEANELRHQVESLEQQLAQAQVQSTSETGVDNSAEISMYETLKGKITEVIAEINTKTEAFKTEGTTVDSVVTQEISALDKLLAKVNEIKGAVDAKTGAFKEEGNAVSDSAKQAVKVKAKEVAQKKEKDIFGSDKEKAAKSISSYFNSLNLDFVSDSAIDKLSEMETRLKNITNSNDLDKWKQDWKEVTKSISQAVKEEENIALSTQKQKLNGIKNSLSKSFKATGIDSSSATGEQKDLADSVIDLTARLETYAKQRKQLSAEEIASLQKEANAIKEKADAYIKAAEAAEKASKVYGDKEVNKATDKKIQISGVAKSDEFAGSVNVSNALVELNTAYDALIAKQKEFKGINPTEEQKEEFANLTNQYNQAYETLNKLIISSRNLEKQKIWGKSVSELSVKPTEDLKASLTEAINASVKGKVKIGEFNAELKQLNYSVSDGNGSWINFKAQLDSTGTKIVGLNSKLKQTDGLFKTLFSGSLNKFKQALTRFTGFDLFYKGVNEIRKGVQSVKEIDSALTELKKVTDETDESYAQFLQTMSKTGAEIGATVSNLINMAANWARLGYSMEEAGNLAKSTAVLLNVSEFTDAEAASEALISTIQAYGYAAEDSMHVVDVLNEIGNNFAISSDGIATALQDSASALMSAGNNLEQSVAMVAAANKVLQDPSQVGGALRTISLRIRGTSVEVLEEMGEETDGVVESVSKLQSKIKGLTGVNILNDAGGYKDTYTIIKEIAEVWDDLTDINKAATLELLAGKNRSNAMAAMLTNLDDLTAAYEDAMNAQGSAEAENEKYLDSIQGKIDQFNNALQTMWMNGISSDFVKSIVDFGTELIKIVDTLGLIPSILAAIAVIGLFKGTTPILKQIGTALSEIIIESVKTGKSIGEIAKETKIFGEISVGSFAKVKEGLKSIGAFIKANPYVAVIAAIITVGTAAVSIYKQVKQAETEAAESALQHAQTIQESNSTLDGYKAKIDTLRDSLDKGNLSEEEAYNARKELISIQDELVSKYDNEVKGINLVTGAIDDQIAKLDELKAKQASEWIAENSQKTGKLGFGKSVIDQAINVKNERRNKYLTLNDNDEILPIFENTFGDRGIAEMQRFISQFEKEIEKLGGNATYDLMTGTFGVGFTNQTREELATSYDELTSWLLEYAKTHGVSLNDLIGKFSKGKEDFLGSDYETQTANYETYMEQAALASYTKQYKAILDAQKDFKEAYSKGDLTEAANAKKRLQDTVQAAQDAVKGSDMEGTLDVWFGELITDSMQTAFANIDFDVAWDEAGNNLKTSIKQTLKDINLNSDIDILNLGNFIDENGKLIEGTEGFTQAQANAYNTLKTKAAEYGMSIDELIAKLVQLGVVQGNTFAATPIESAGKAYSSYASTLEKFTSAGTIANEILYDNIELTEEQGKALQELIGSEAEYAEAVDSSNGYIVKNARLAKDLIAKKRLEAAQNAKVEKTQARLQYYDLYKQIHKLSQANGELSAKNKDQINILYNEMKTVAQTIQKYATLERQLLGVANAYTEFANAKEIDDANTYDSELSEMVQYLANAFNTGELGTAQAQAAINGLVPQEVIDRAGTLDERMQHIYDYFTGGPLSKYVTVEFDEEGSMTSAEITMDNVKQFIEDGIAGIDGVQAFTGSWESFDLAPNIKSLSDLAEAYNLTEDAIFAMLQTAEKYDISWLGGDFTTLMDQLMGDDLEYNLQKNMGIISEYEQKLANGNATMDDVQRYKDSSAALAEYTQQARENAKAYSDASVQYNKAKEEAEAANKAIAEAGEGVDTSDLQKQVDKAIEKMQEYGQIMADNEMTELIVQVAIDDIDVDIKKIEEQYSNIKEQVTQGDDGKWIVNSEFKGKMSPELKNYIALLNERHTLEVMQGEELPTVLNVLEQIRDILNTNLELKVNTDDATTKTSIFADLWEGIKSKTVTLTTLTSNVGEGIKKFIAGKKGEGEFQGSAHATGDWGLKSNEHNALVGELGQETVVDPHTGRYYTVGDNGAELVDLPKDAIIFNHKQTEELFKNGHINSRGKAYAEGNAHVDLVKKSTYGVNTWTKKINQVSPDWGSSSAAAAASAAKAAEDAAEDVSEIFDWFEVLLEEINEQLDLMSAKLENAVGIEAKSSILGELLSGNHYKLTELNEGLKLYTDYAAKMLSKVPDEYKEMAKNGAVAITDFLGEANQETVEAINNYREWAQKVADLNQQLEETRTTISDLRVQTLDMIRTEYDNEIGLITTANDHIQSTIDLLEEKGQRSSSNFYTEMITNSEKQLDKLKEQREAMQKELDDAVASGDVKKYSEDWYDMLNAIYDVDSAIIDCKTDIEKFDNAILELHWENFEKIIDALDAVSDEAEQIRSIIDDSEITDDVGNWTKNGLTALGMAAQEMEKARYRADLYGKEIEQLNKDFSAGKYSQDEYNEKLKELKDAQWDSIEAYESAKDTLVDLNKTRVEAVKDGLQKEIDAYEKLIDKRKEDLNAQKDAHDWANTLKDRTDEIDKIQRQIDAMAGDTSAAANAQRKKLQEELANAQKELDETYYDRDIEMQQKALDDSLESYRQNKEDRMQELEDYLENEDQVVSDSYALILANTDAIASNLQEIAQRYGISISENVTAPWESGMTALGTYGEELDYATSSYVDMLEKVRKELIDLQIEADKTAAKLVKDINTSANQSQNANKTPAPSQSSTPAKSAPSLTTGSQVVVKPSATTFARDGGNGTRMQSWVPGGTFTVYQVSGDQVLIGLPGKGYTGWVRKQDIVGYAKGTTGVKKDQFAVIDENGLEELVMHADGGKLSYLTKGTAVVPNDLTNNIMKWGEIDPVAILDRNKPSIGAPHIIENQMQIDMSIAEVVHIEHADRDSIPEIQDAVKKQLDSYMKNLNSGIKKYTR